MGFGVSRRSQPEALIPRFVGKVPQHFASNPQHFSRIARRRLPKMKLMQFG
jgi:hypothetical protein